MPDPVADPMAVVERVLQLLDEGAFVATYKHAVLLGLLDVLVARADRDGHPPDAVTTRELAEAVIALYWPQVRPWGEGGIETLRQNASPGMDIVGFVRAFQLQLGHATGASVPLVRACVLDPDGWKQLRAEVEWKLIEMPLPKLQRVGGEDVAWLYRIAWDDGRNAPKKGTVRAYQQGTLGPFDNQIRLLPGVAVALTRLHGVLRPFIQQHWAAKVARLNGLEEARLQEWLFGAERTSLEPVRAGLVALQEGACFYCGESLRRGQVHVDHFLPWARHPDNALANLVAADSVCNGQKRDFLASGELLGRWRSRLDQQLPVLNQIAAHARWEVGDERALGAARALYLPLPDDVRLWAGRSRWERLDRRQVREVLG
jgi:5-methylcytosine-specific restriction endonuclease McrA